VVVNKLMAAIAKSDHQSGVTRSLIGHSLDVAHSAYAMLTRGTSRRRLGAAAGLDLTDVHVSRLAVLVGLHDVGKTTNGFQDRINGRGRGTGHVAEAVAVVNAHGALPDAVRSAICADLINVWCDEPGSILYAIFCHHGEPVPQLRIDTATASLTQQWASISAYDPIAEVDALTRKLLDVFPQSLENAVPFPATKRFEHLLAGLTMTADWMGSDTRFHPLDGDESRPTAAINLLDGTRWSGWHSGSKPQALLGHYRPRGAQVSMLELPLAEQLVFVEAPTGSGKTEAALIWADRLVAAGLVDGMYFAVPTRSAATELHDRISKVMGNVHAALLGRVVRAVPGMIDVDRPPGIWDEPTAPTWALGSTRRVMSAPIAVGTIDQAMLAKLRTRHSWLRAWCLARQLLVVDEVHASDPYMSEIIAHLVQEHLLTGGYALLMSATLGETLRAKLERRPRVDISAATARPYPEVATPDKRISVEIAGVRTTNIVIQDHAVAIERAQDVAKQGAAVLWVRSTVADALDDYHTLQAGGAPVMLHHSRFADVDRQYLDRQVLGLIGLGARRKGIVIVGTQTLEQSLDIDADLLVSDAVPADVFIQRLGRLHRHRTGTFPTAILLDPGDWEARVTSQGTPLGGPGQGWAWIYNPLAVRETVEWLRAQRSISVPGDVREVVELASHVEHLEQRALALGQRWVELWKRFYAHAMAAGQQALSGLIDQSQGYDHALVNERVLTRLGDGSVDVEVEGELKSPFTGEYIRALSIRGSWLREAEPGSPAVVVGADTASRTLVDVGGAKFTYGIEGLHRASR
jgi:CRISPR-associated endonuclease/helicase Cas3